MADIYPPEYDTPVGQVRLLVPDLEQLEDPTDLTAEESYLFSDAQLQTYLVLARNNIYRAAALAVNAIAASEILILKNLKSDDRQTQGDKVGDALGRRADWLLKEAELEDIGASEEAFEIIYPSFCPDNSGWLR